ncbi:MAG TPA: TIGR03435 family protein [Bryobacteraceae bacterium]|nr:TIGR03435 family protein [Bryobacteraceae bacterium]
MIYEWQMLSHWLTTAIQSMFGRGIVSATILLCMNLAQQASLAAPAVVVQSDSRPQFEVASVKSCDPHVARGPNAGSRGPGGVAYNCLPLIQYIRIAYRPDADLIGRYGVLPSPRIEGGPAWINKDLYRITARTATRQDSAVALNALMRNLLETRFKLKIHHEAREIPAYALVLAKGGLRLPAAKVGCVHRGDTIAPGTPRPPSCGFGERTVKGIVVRGSTMEDFCYALSTSIPLDLDRRPILNHTSTQGQFDFDLKFPPADSNSDAGRGVAMPGAPGEDLALLQRALENLGLKLVPATTKVDILIVDSAERPTEN